MTAKRPHQMAVKGLRRSSPDAITLVPCPVCKYGMLDPSIAAAVKEILDAARTDGPSGSSLPPLEDIPSQHPDGPDDPYDDP